MPLETGSTINDLDQTWPLGSDKVLEGDNHLRLLKAVLKSQFPGINGNGFATPILATEMEINFLSGVTSSIQNQINAITANDALRAPVGTVLVFFQATPPAGWTQIAANNDSMLRVVSAAGGGVGGTVSPITIDFFHTHTTGDHALTQTEIPAHVHTLDFSWRASGSGDNSSSFRLRAFGNPFCA